MKIVVIIIIVLIVLYSLNKLIIYRLKKDIIYKKLKELNRFYFFVDIPKKIIINEYVNSKKSLLKYNFQEKVLFLINTNQDNLLIYIQDIYHNRKYLKEYNKEYLNILNSINYNKLKKYYLKKLLNKIKLKPKINFSLKIKVIYKNYNVYSIYTYDELLLLVKKLKDVKLRKELKRKFMKQERSKMSNSLRYDVLKRDNFKCCVCGYGSLDNVKLHVDHIIPVSRGGKTKLDNLQTLCDRCNLGKSDKV